ncbi:hypothetical protein D3C73_1213740 [compost metagenome]
MQTHLNLDTDLLSWAKEVGEETVEYHKTETQHHIPVDVLRTLQPQKKNAAAPTPQPKAPTWGRAVPRVSRAVPSVPNAPNKDLTELMAHNVPNSRSKINDALSGLQKLHKPNGR